MKINQKLSILAISFSLLLAGNIHAQEARPEGHQMENGAKLTPEQRADKRSQLLKDKLKLSDQQASQVKSAILEFEQNRTGARDDMRKNHESLEVTLGSIFTPEQKKQYDEMQEKRKAEMKARMQERKGKGPAPEENNK